MNKFLTIFALVAVAVGCSALNDAEIQQEVGQLRDNQTLFKEFCLEQREFILDDIQRRSNEMSASMFRKFFDNAAEIADEVMLANKRATKEFSQTIKMPDQEVDAPSSDDEIGQMITDGKREIASQGNFLGRMLVATKNMAGRAIIEPAYAAISKRFAKVRDIANSNTALKGFLQSCTQVGEYEAILSARFMKTKQLISQETESELQKFIDDLDMSQLQCHTTKSITRLSGFCNLFVNGIAPFMKMIGKDPNFQLPSSEEPILSIQE